MFGRKRIIHSKRKKGASNASKQTQKSSQEGMMKQHTLTSPWSDYPKPSKMLYVSRVRSARNTYGLTPSVSFKMMRSTFNVQCTRWTKYIGRRHSLSLWATEK